MDLKKLNSVQDFINQNNPLTEEDRSKFKSDGFLLPSTFTADGNGLPYSKVSKEREGKIRRNIITWFVPEFGTVRMYINPNQITYSHKKIITPERTKGGYTLQYWGEDLTRLQIQGTTGSAGIEGINMLYEIYRAEQYSSDSLNLSLAASAYNSSTNLGTQIVSDLSKTSNNAAIAGAITLGAAGLYSPNANSLASKNITSLAQLAFSVEMYYDGWVYRGYFEGMSVTESSDNFLISYSIDFVATQKRGYRVNYFPFHRTPDGPSRYDSPHSVKGSK